MAPFIIFSDVALKEMATKLPITAEQFLSIKGVGNQKFDRYGQAFMNVIIAYLNEHPEIVSFFPSRNERKEEKKW